MTDAVYRSFYQWYTEGRLSPFVQTVRSLGGFLTLVKASQPAGDMSDPAIPDLVLYQAMSGNIRVDGDLGAGKFKTITQKDCFFLAAPNFANNAFVEKAHQFRSISFPVGAWAKLLEDFAMVSAAFDFGRLHSGSFTSPLIRSAIERLWRLSDEEGLTPRLLAQAAGCEILAELNRMDGASVVTPRGGLAPWAERRSIDLIRARHAENIGLDEIASDVGLSPFHFSRMFKQSVGMPPRAFLVRQRIERASELLEKTALPVTEIALEVGYSSSQVLARVFMKHKRMSPSAYRRAAEASSVRAGKSARFTTSPRGRQNVAHSDIAKRPDRAGDATPINDHVLGKECRSDLNGPASSKLFFKRG